MSKRKYLRCRICGKKTWAIEESESNPIIALVCKTCHEEEKLESDFLDSPIIKNEEELECLDSPISQAEVVK